MIYLIGGPARTGKTMVRQRIMRDYGIEGVSTDFFRSFLEITYPKSGISHLVDPVINMGLAAQFMKNFILAARHNGKDYIIEGDMIDPELMLSINFKPMDMRCIFLGYSNQDLSEKLSFIRANETEDDWTKEYSDQELKKKIKQFLRHSSIIESKCKKAGIPYLDVQHFSKKEVYERAIYMLGIVQKKPKTNPPVVANEKP